MSKMRYYLDTYIPKGYKFVVKTNNKSYVTVIYRGEGIIWGIDQKKYSYERFFKHNPDHKIEEISKTEAQLYMIG